MSMLCSRCKKRVAVVFMTRMENGKTINEGLCLHCARDLGIKQVDDLMKNMGITEDDLKNMDEQMEGLMEMSEGEDGESRRLPAGRRPDLPFFAKSLRRQPLATGVPRRNPPPAIRRGLPNPSGRKSPSASFWTTTVKILRRRPRRASWIRIIGRDEEIYRVVQILNRRTKNNPCLIGEPGVGKTAIAEGLALRIARGQCAC